MARSRWFPVVALGGSALLASGACGGPGLPPAGPAPGEVEVGYDTRPKQDVTGSVSSVYEEEINDATISSLEDLLRGRVAGLQVIRGPAGRTILRIRGPDSIQMQQEPLIILDGVQLGSTDLRSALAGLTRGDIRQVDVLKDISSTAIYGMRGAGGVILITTRR